jgi:protein gp37
MSARLKAMGQRNYRNGFQLTLHRHLLDAPLHWKKPQIVFVNSMSDLFQDKVPLGFIQDVFGTMRDASRHQFQVLTKRSERLRDLSPHLPWAENIWMGVSVENEDYQFRIDHLRQTGAAIKFLSIEPLLGPLPSLDLTGIDWVIVGGESGPGSRAMKKEWVSSIRDQCSISKVPFFFKQWGGVNKKKSGRKLDGMQYDEMPCRKIATPTLDLLQIAPAQP